MKTVVLNKIKKLKMRGDRKSLARRRLVQDTLLPKSKAHGCKLPVMSCYKEEKYSYSSSFSRGHSSRCGRNKKSQEKKCNAEKDYSQAIKENTLRIEVLAPRRQCLLMQNVLESAEKQQQESRYTGNVCVRSASVLICY